VRERERERERKREREKERLYEWNRGREEEFRVGGEKS